MPCSFCDRPSIGKLTLFYEYPKNHKHADTIHSVYICGDCFTMVRKLLERMERSQIPEHNAGICNYLSKKTF